MPPARYFEWIAVRATAFPPPERGRVRVIGARLGVVSSGRIVLSDGAVAHRGGDEFGRMRCGRFAIAMARE